MVPLHSLWRTGRRAQRLRVHSIAFFVHAQHRIGLLCAYVLVLDVQADADHIGARTGAALDLQIQAAEYPAAAVLRMHVDALQPPPIAVAPIAPFKGHQQATHDHAVMFGDPIKAASGFGEDRLRAGTQ